MIGASLVAIVTPMKADGTVDFDALGKLLDWHVASGTQGIVILGTTGEAATIHDDEREAIIRFTVAHATHAKKRYTVIVGTGTNATDSTIQLTQQAKTLGADVSLIVTPYYNKPTQEGLFQHYSAIAHAVDMPIILYNVPGRTACDLKPETIARLSSVKNIIGVKEATGDLDRVAVLRKLCGNDFLLWSGDDGSALAFMLLGGNGVISVTSNVAPEKMRAMCDAALNGDLNKAKELDASLAELHKNLFLEANPIPVKWCLSRMQKMDAGIRLPLTPLSAAHQQPLEKTLKTLGLLT